MSCAIISERVISPIPAQISAEIIKKLSQREANLMSLKGLFNAEVDVEGMAFTQSLQGSILYKRPNQYRIKGFTRFGGLVFDFVLSEGFYALRVEDHPRPIIGGVGNFEKLGEFRLPVLLSLRAIKVVLGKLSLESERIIAAKVDGNTYQFDMSPVSKIVRASFYQRIMVDRVSLQIRQLDYMGAEGKTVVSIHTSDFRQVRDGSSSELRTFNFPFDVRVEDRIEVGSIALEFQEIKANVPLERKMFTLNAF